MKMIDPGRMEILMGEYAVGSATALRDPLLVNRAQDYRRLVAGAMRAREEKDIPKEYPESKYYLSLKVDGEFDLLFYLDGECFLVNPGGTVRTGLPALKEAAQHFQRAGIKNAVVAAEYYFKKDPGKRSRVHDISRAARQPASVEELSHLCLAVFDLLECDGEQFSGPQYSIRWEKLNAIFAQGEMCHLVETHECTNATEIQKHFRKYVDGGAEGIVVRSEEVGFSKIKPRHTLDAVVIGFTESTDDRVGMLHDLLLAVMREDGCLHIIGHVGGGFTNDDRRNFLSDLKDMIVSSDYAEVNDQVAYHMVKPEWIVEISVLDLITTSTRGQSVNKMVLQWDSAKQHYGIVRRLPMVGLISPQFLRKREDKQFVQHDIRIKQITDLVEVAFTDRDARELSLPASTVLKREVQTKVLKESTMVRKLVMWKTNKETINPDYPAYVVHLTDYSPNRKTPLERDIRVSNSLEQIEELWQELAAEYFTKGWAPVGAAPAAKPAVAKAKAPKKAASTADPVVEQVIDSPAETVTAPVSETRAPEVVEDAPVTEEPAPTPAKKAAVTRKSKAKPVAEEEADSPPAEAAPKKSTKKTKASEEAVEETTKKPAKKSASKKKTGES
ncbi:MAG: hypothetical protein R3B84_12155 [Zavarzinella sp.]